MTRNKRKTGSKEVRKSRKKFPRMFRKICVFVLTFQGTYLAISQVNAPYPPSPIIDSVIWEEDSKVQFGLGSDQWPMTWSDDGDVYAAWGDGWGWTRGEEAKRSLGITRVAGSPPDISGEDVYGIGPGQNFGKPDALIAFDNRIYMFWTNGDSKYENDSFTAVSLDSGKTWKLGKERFLKYAPAGFRVRGILQYGKGYQGAMDEYLYIYFGLNRHPDIYLARVKKEEVFNERAYEWFVYMDENGQPYWTLDFSRKATAFHDNNAYLWHLSICYNSGLDRYILTKPHFSTGDNRNEVRAPDTNMSSFGIFDAPTPWGPWTTVYYQENFMDELLKFNYVIPTKYISNGGQKFWLGWSGWPEYDNVTFMKGRFLLKE